MKKILIVILLLSFFKTATSQTGDEDKLRVVGEFIIINQPGYTSVNFEYERVKKIVLRKDEVLSVVIREREEESDYQIIIVTSENEIYWKSIGENTAATNASKAYRLYYDSFLEANTFVEEFLEVCSK